MKNSFYKFYTESLSDNFISKKKTITEIVRDNNRKISIIRGFITPQRSRDLER